MAVVAPRILCCAEMADVISLFSVQARIVHIYLFDISVRIRILFSVFILI